MSPSNTSIIPFRHPQKLPRKAPTNKWSTSHYDLQNINGSLLCHAIKCRKHTKLQFVHGGLFCLKHRKSLDHIREQLQIAKQLDNLSDECVWRQNEIEFRKISDAGHMHWQYKLECLMIV